jgi:hypothetical protein
VIVRTIVRVLWASLAFIIAASVALGTLFFLGAIWVGDELRAAAPDDPLLRQHGAAPVFGMVLFASTVAPALTALPGAIATIAGEALKLRSWMYYVPAGGVSLAAIPVLAPAQPSLPTGQYMAIFAAAGFVGGFVYWLLAGRNA